LAGPALNRCCLPQGTASMQGRTIAKAKLELLAVQTTQSSRA
jgi:hypothetical protein